MRAAASFTATQPELNGEITCGVCLEPWDGPVELRPCSHIFCGACDGGAFVECPACRKRVSGRQPPHRALVNLANAAQVRCEGCGWEGSREQSRSHSCRDAGPSSSVAPACRRSAASPPSMPATLVQGDRQHDPPAAASAGLAGRVVPLAPTNTASPAAPRNSKRQQHHPPSADDHHAQALLHLTASAHEAARG